MQLARARFGGLDARVVSPPGAEDDGPVVVLLHGFGAPGHDLVPLAQHIGAPAGTRFVFPEAPIDLGPAFAGGRAWWMIDMMKLQAAMARGAFRDLAREIPEGLAEARAMLGEAVDAIEDALRPRALVLGGFSQGAMLSMDYALRSERPLAALVLFSGTVIAETEWEPLFEDRRGLEVAQSHGRLDPVLPFVGAERLRGLMEEAGWRVDFVPFTGMHEIPLPALEAASAVLERALG